MPPDPHRPYLIDRLFPSVGNFWSDWVAHLHDREQVAVRALSEASASAQEQELRVRALETELTSSLPSIERAQNVTLSTRRPNSPFRDWSFEVFRDAQQNLSRVRAAVPTEPWQRRPPPTRVRRIFTAIESLYKPFLPRWAAGSMAAMYTGWLGFIIQTGHPVVIGSVVAPTVAGPAMLIVAERRNPQNIRNRLLRMVGYRAREMRAEVDRYETLGIAQDCSDEAHRLQSTMSGVRLELERANDAALAFTGRSQGHAAAAVLASVRMHFPEGTTHIDEQLLPGLQDDDMMASVIFEYSLQHVRNQAEAVAGFTTEELLAQCSDIEDVRVVARGARGVPGILESLGIPVQELPDDVRQAILQGSRSSSPEVVDKFIGLARDQPDELRAAAERYTEQKQHRSARSLQSSDLPPNIGALTGAIEFATQLAEQRTTPPASSDVTPHTTTGVESTFPSALPADAPTTDRALPEQDTATPRREPPIEEVMEALGESEPQTDPHSGPHPDRPPGPLRRARQEPPNRTDNDEVRRPIDHNPETPGLDDGTGRGLGLPDQ